MSDIHAINGSNGAHVTNGSNGSTNIDHRNGTSTNEKNTNRHPSNALCGVEEFLSRSYDYVVIGGGTAGLCVAARLTENPEVTVAVLEGGSDRMDDPMVSTPAMYAGLIGREKYDWCFNSVPQPDAGGKSYSMPRGKLLGGSSGINYLMYVRGSKSDYEGWESLGNKGWGWEGMLPYFRKHQTLDAVKKLPKDIRFMPHAAKEKYHGTDGPIHTSFNDYYAPIEEDFVQACYEVGGGENTLHDAYSGDHLGFYSSLAAVDRTKDVGKRSYAATAYLRPNLDRPNLKVLTEALASQIVLDGNTAKGVKFLHNGQSHTVHAKKEVVLSAGTIQTPQVLELSGIGDPAILAKAGVECHVENKRVGANFQDHVLGGMMWDLKEGITGFDSLHGKEFAKIHQEIYEKTGGGMYSSPGMLMGFVSYASIVSKEVLEETIAEMRANSLAETDFEKAQEDIIVSQLSDPNFANLQTFCFPATLDVSAGSDQTKFFAVPPEGKCRLSLFICLEHPLSRGTVHIESSDPTKQPRIDPGYFRQAADAKILAAGVDWLNKVSQRPILKEQLGERLLPPEGASLETEEERIEYVRNHISTQYHLCGSAGMGEVVDDRLRVNGVRGLRVVDASVFPGHVSGNIMSTTYAVAEKGADLIKEDDGRF